MPFSFRSVAAESYSIIPDLDLEVRRCTDGVLIYEGVSRSTHLLSPAAWELFLAMAEGRVSVVGSDSNIESPSSCPYDDGLRQQLIEALESAGLVSRC